MSDQIIYRVRVFYGKTGRLALLSHLEVARALERAIRRAELPYAISQGFSPHMKIAFGSALPVGVGGLRECFDLQLTRNIPPKEVLAALKKTSAPDLMVTACEHLGAKAKAASVAYPIANYQVVLAKAFKGKLLVPETITVIRKKKEKMLKISDYLVGDLKLEATTLEFSLESHATGSLRADAFVATLVDLNPGFVPTAVTRVNSR